MPYRLLFFIANFFPLVYLSAQDERPFRRYATQEVHQKILEQDLEFSQHLAAMEDHIQSYGTTGSSRKDTIPIIFHIVYSAGQAVPDKADVLEQIEALNRDFGEYKAPMESYIVNEVQMLTEYASDPGVFFCLPENDVIGNPIDPIQYVETDIPAWYPDDAMKKTTNGGVPNWSPDKFLNVWVVYLEDNWSGYAQMPGGPSSTDGIVIDARYMVNDSTDEWYGKYYAQGKTLTHLVGTYLGLYELWDEFVPCNDDKVDDTPIHNTINYFSGEINYHISLCDSIYQAEMIMNFMDNTDDKILNMFTQGQKNRMKAVLSTSGLRGQLVTGIPMVCSPLGLRSTSDHAVNKTRLASYFQLQPNPALQSFNLILSPSHSGNVICSVSNMLGDVLWRDDVFIESTSMQIPVDCSSWGQGIYIVTVAFSDGTIAAREISVNRI